jgi:hypothetical protein
LRAYVACALFAAGLLVGAPPAARAAAKSEEPALLDTFVKRWATIDDYTATIVAHEVDGDRVDDRTMRFWFRKPDRAKLVMTGGGSKGSALFWTGGTHAHVRAAGFPFFPLWLDLHSGAITSLRGNTMLRPDLGPTVACFAAHPESVREGTGPQIDGHATRTLTLEVPGGLGCDGDPPKDREVTKDVLTLTRDQGLVVLRERFAGPTLVEHWEVRDIRINVGLTDDDFKD